ncbi:hypothetical protein PLESTM_000714900 [Pleodorina starrii]|nr:hypothetical protein PLESTM_000714900 [Pleodorina starrii]
MNQQLLAEQAMRRQDTAALDTNMKAMEGALVQAQDQVVRRTVAMLEGKAGQLMRALADVDGAAQIRDEEARVAGEQQLGAFVKAAARKEKVGLERMMVLEGALRDIAAASSASLEALQARLDQGLGQVAAAVDAARATTEDREAGLRTQINAALQKIRAYARDMEESLEQERIKLEEVVKLEIRARQQSTEALKEALDAGVVKMADRVTSLENWQKRMGGMSDETIKGIETFKAETHRLQTQLEDDLAALRSAVTAHGRDLSALQSAAAAAERDVEALRRGAADAAAAAAALAADLAAAKAEIGGAKGELAAAKGELGATKADLAGTKGELGEVKAEVAGHKAQLGGHATQLEGLRSGAAATAADVAALRQQTSNDLNGLRTELQQETAERRRTDAELKHWFDQNQVDAKLAEEALRLEVDSLSRSVDQRFGAVEAEAERVRQRAAKDRQDHDALEALVQVHSDVFEDVQKKLTSLDQRAKTGEANLANAVEDIHERIEVAAKSAAKDAADIRAAAAALSDSLDERLAAAAEALAVQGRELDEKMERNQRVLEDVMAQYQEETHSALGDLTVKNEELQRMLEDEVTTLDEHIESKVRALDEKLTSALEETNEAITTASAASAAAMKALAEEIATRTKDLTQKIEEARDEADAGMDELEGEVEEKLAEAAKATKELLDSTRGRLEAAFVALGAEVRQNLEGQKAEVKSALDSQHGDVAAALAAQQSDVRELVAAQREALEVAVEEQRGALEAGAALMRRELGEAMQAQTEAVDAARSELLAALAAAQTDINVALEEQRSDVDKARGEMEAARGEMEAARGELGATVAATKADFESAIGAQKADMKAAIEELVVAIDQEKIAFAEFQANQKADLQDIIVQAHEQIETSRREVASMHAAQQASVVVQQAALAASVQKQAEALQTHRDEVEAAFEDALEQMQSDVADRIQKELAEYKPLEDFRAEVRQRLVEADQAAASGRKELERRVAEAEEAAAGARAQLEARLEQQLSSQLQEQAKKLDEQIKALDDHSKLLDKHIREFDEHARALDEHVRALDEQADALDEHDKAFEQAAKARAELEKQLAEMQGRLDEIGRQLAEDKDEAIKHDVDAVQRDVGEVRGDVDTVRERVEGLYDKMDEHTAQVDEMLAKQEALLRQIKDQPSGPTKDELMSEVTKLLQPIRKEMDELRKERDDDDVVMSYELDERLGQERAETGKQLEAMKAQLAKDAEAAVRAGEAALKRSAKEDAVADLEKKMHAALDASLDRIRGEVSEDIKPLQLDVERLKAAVQKRETAPLDLQHCVLDSKSGVLILKRNDTSSGLKDPVELLGTAIYRLRIMGPAGVWMLEPSYCRPDLAAATYSLPLPGRYSIEVFMLYSTFPFTAPGKSKTLKEPWAAYLTLEAFEPNDAGEVQELRHRWSRTPDHAVLEPIAPPGAARQQRKPQLVEGLDVAALPICNTSGPVPGRWRFRTWPLSEAAPLLRTCVFGNTTEENCNSGERAPLHRTAHPATLYWQPDSCRMPPVLGLTDEGDGDVWQQQEQQQQKQQQARRLLRQPQQEEEEEAEQQQREKDEEQQQQQPQKRQPDEHPPPISRERCFPPGRRVCFVGDSHSRYLHNSFVMWMSNYTVHVNNDAKQVARHDQASHMRVNWGHDWPKRNNLVTHGNCTDVVANVGQWATSHRAGEAPHSAAMYIKSVRHIRLKMLAMRQGFGTRVFWVNSCLPSIHSYLVLENRSWRTDPYLTLYNRLATDIMRDDGTMGLGVKAEGGGGGGGDGGDDDEDYEGDASSSVAEAPIPVIDAWSPTHILPDLTRDGTHFDNVGLVGRVLLHAVLHALCSETT